MCRPLRWSFLFVLSLPWFMSQAWGQDLLPVLPALRDAGAPTCLKEGLRLSYYSAVASVPAAMYYYSPNENGDWVGGDGKRWDRFDQPGAAGQGYTQVDVLAVDPAQVVLHSRSWQHQIITGPLVPGSPGSLISIPGGGDWWIHPKVLERVPNIIRTDPGTLEELKILRMPMKIPSNKKYQVLRFQYERDRARHVVAYDIETGLLIFKASLTVAPKHLWTRGNTLLTEMWLVDQRQVKVPWAGESLPEAFTPGAKMRYEGSTSAGLLGSRPNVLSLTADLVVATRGKTWAQYDQTVRLGGIPGAPAPMPEQMKLVTGTQQFGGLWIPPESLQLLKIGQVLDSDPITKEEIRVSDSRTEGNRKIVVITAASRAARAEVRYDATNGYLLGGQTNQSSEMVRTTAELRLTRGLE